jgi:formamidopyrimidine-DNA glycosylase
MDEVDRLHGSIRRTLNDAIAAGGTTVRDYRGADGEEGGYQFALAVYGREGEGCLRCGTAVERQVVAGRGTRLCPACQVAP